MQQQNGKKVTGLGLRLLELRGSATQSEFARSIGVIQQTYAHWELGVRQPKLQELARLAQHFGVSTDWLLGLTDVKALQQNASAESNLKLYIATMEHQLQRYKTAFAKIVKSNRLIADVLDDLQEDGR